jgi:DNA-binding response OmpR family regulator
MKKVLIVEDDQAMTVALSYGFESQGFLTEVAQDGREGVRLAMEKAFDILILDVMLPRLSGLDVCKQLRRQGSELPIIMLTARGQEIDKVLGLKGGADDYVTKPFSFMELLARVEAVLRRAGRIGLGPGYEDCYQFGDVFLDFKKLEATKAGRPLDLTPREFKILKYFIEHRGELVTRDQLLDSVWGYDNNSLTRTVDIHIGKLRRKIEDNLDNASFIITVYGAGYKFLG